MAITEGSTCYCGDEIPATQYQVANSSCDTPCNGYGTDMCGGSDTWTVYLTGLSADVDTEDSGSSSSSSTTATPTTKAEQPTSQVQATITQAGQTIIVTQAAQTSAIPKSSSGGPNKVGIAVGVVVGVIAVAAVVGSTVFFLKQRKKRAIEEEHARIAAGKEFSSTSSRPETKSSADQRLDQTNIFTHRRQSIGSIADERDFSRRILQVF